MKPLPTIDVFPIADIDFEYDELVVVDRVDDAVVADADTVFVAVTELDGARGKRGF